MVYTYLDEKADEKVDETANTTDVDKAPKANAEGTTAVMFNNRLNQNTDDRVNDGAVADQARDALAAQALANPVWAEDPPAPVKDE